MTPYLQLLLNRKKNDPSTYGPWSERLPDGTPAMASAMGQQPSAPTGPTIPLRSIPSSAPILAPGVDVSSLGDAPAPQPVGTGTHAIAPTAATVAPSFDPYQSRIEADRQRILDAQAHPQSTGKRILEGLGDWAAAGVGLPLERIIHPHGTETQQAQRQLAQDVLLQKAQTEQQASQADTANTQSTIALRSKQIAKLQDEMANPDTSDADKAEAAAIAEGVKAFASQSPTPKNDQIYADLRARAAKHGVSLPATYGPKAALARPERNVVNGKILERQPDGSWKTVYAGETSGKPDLTPYQQKQRQADAAALVGKIEKARQSAQAFINQEEEDRKSTKPDVNKQAQLRVNYGKALSEGQAAAAELQQGYGDLYQAGQGTADTRGNAWPFYKPVSQAAPVTTPTAAPTGKPRTVRGMVVKDPQVQRYADSFFGGDYNKAQSAIKQQRGQ